jgi:hypothetical protein
MSEGLKVIIAGSRSFWDYRLLEKEVDNFRLLYDISEIVSGGARGADMLGEQYARYHNLLVRRLSAHWDVYGKTAGFIRNGEMAEYADALIAFNRGTPGTSNMIEQMTKRKKIVKVVCVE